MVYAGAHQGLGVRVEARTWEDAPLWSRELELAASASPRVEIDALGYVWVLGAFQGEDAPVSTPAVVRLHP